MLLQIENECLDVYKRKEEGGASCEVQGTASSGLFGFQSITFKSFISLWRERLCWNFLLQPEEMSGTIKEQLAAIAPAVEQLWEQKEERVKEFSDVRSQIHKICGEVAGSLNLSDQPPAIDETDLSLKKFDEYQAHLQELQKNKSDHNETWTGYILCAKSRFCCRNSDSDGEWGRSGQRRRRRSTTAGAGVQRWWSDSGYQAGGNVGGNPRRWRLVSSDGWCQATAAGLRRGDGVWQQRWSDGV